MKLKKEQHYVNLLQPLYNILKKVGYLLAFKHSNKTIKTLINCIVSTETRDNLSVAASKRIYSDKEKTNLSNSHLGKKLSLATRTKISDSATELWGKAVQVKYTQLGTSERYPSLTASANNLKVSRTANSKAIHTGKLLRNRWLLTYIT